MSIEEYDSFLQELHPPHPPRYDVNLARAKRQAGEQTYEFDSDEEENDQWDEWGAPSSCSRYLEKHFRKSSIVSFAEHAVVV